MIEDALAEKIDLLISNSSAATNSTPQVLAAVANKGVLVPPRVIDAWVDADGEERAQKTPAGRRVMSEEHAATLTEMLIGVTQEGGHRRVRLDRRLPGGQQDRDNGDPHRVGDRRLLRRLHPGLSRPFSVSIKIPFFFALASKVLFMLVWSGFLIKSV